MSTTKSIVALCALGLLIGASQAAPVNGTGNVTPDVIFGSGNANGSFTGQTANNIEVALRAKQRYPAANIFNYDGVDTYSFTNGANPANRSIFNFEWSINVDQGNSSGARLSDFSYLLSFDTDPSSGVAYTVIDPFNIAGYFDHSLGNNATANGGGIEFGSLAAMQAQLGNFSVAQQSSNLGFGFSLDPDLPGLYNFRLEVFEKGTTNLLAASQITAQVPEPASLALIGVALAGLAVSRRRKQVR